MGTGRVGVGVGAGEAAEQTEKVRKARHRDFYFISSHSPNEGLRNVPVYPEASGVGAGVPSLAFRIHGSLVSSQPEEQLEA